MNSELECYGRMFPPALAPERKGKVFSLQLSAPGMAAMHRNITVDRDAWRHCMECPEFEACYRLSTATLLLEASLN